MVFRVQKTLLEVQLVTEGVTARVVGLLLITSACRQETLAAGVDESIVRHAHLIGRGLVIDLTAVL